MKTRNLINAAPSLAAVLAAAALMASLLLPDIAQAVAKTGTGLMKGDTIRYAVKAYIEKNMPWDRDNVHILFPLGAPDVAHLGDKVNYEVRAAHGEEYIGDTVFKVLFFRDDTLIREEPVRVRVEVMLQVPVAARAIERDVEIRTEDIKMAGRWYTRLPSNSITDPAGIIGKRAAVGIRPNSEIARGMVKNSILVKRGRVVRIVLESGPMRILSVGLAEEDGSRNDVVRVRNTSSNKMVYARVIEDSIVKVEF
jgi:flagella basal body P-ring formation protein FlgA